jgi:hypothetical protein
MMEAIVFVPALVCIGCLFYWGPQKTFLYVCLPVLLLLPAYFTWKINGFPGVGFDTSVLLPLGVSLIALASSHWKPTRCDIWIAFYILSSAVADLRVGEASLAKYRLFEVVVRALVPYAVGRLLIEQNHARRTTAKQIILIFCFSSLLAIPEFFLKLNLFLRGGMHFFPDQWPGWSTQVRWGFGRIAGPFGTSEVYGLVLIVGVFLLPWMYESPSSRRLRWYSSKKAAFALSILLVLTLIMTQSRGPWLGMLIALPIAFCGFTKRPSRSLLLICCVFLLLAVPMYKGFMEYSGGPRKDYGSDRETAQYRHEMIENYVPLAEQGGLWGWGTFHPVVNGQTSIDNEFLRVFLAQGYIGVFSYILLYLEAGYALLRIGLSATSGESRRFCFAMLGIFVAWLITLNTVYMGGQSYELFFLLVGWTQALRPVEAAESPAELKVLQLNRVYS